MAKVTIYTTPTCVYCKMAKEFFKKNGVDYEERNVAEDEAALQTMMRKSQQMSVPVIEVGDQVFVGFDRPNIAKALNIA